MVLLVVSMVETWPRPPPMRWLMRVDARSVGDADHVDRSEGRVDGEFLLQIEGLS